MRPHSKIENFVLYTLDGFEVSCTAQPIEVADNAEMPMPKNTISHLTFNKSMEFTMTMKIPKNFRCQSRKRFVKLLMSTGLSRNKANLVARIAREFNVPYGRSWRSTLLHRIGLL